MDVATLQQKLAHGERIVVLDIRPDEQRREWHIPGSLHVPAFDEIWDNDYSALDRAPLAKDVPVVIVCGAGKTSAKAAAYLHSRGFLADNLDGGMRAWSRAWNVAETRAGLHARVVQVRRTGRGCLSYVLVSGGEALVVDASLDPNTYERIAARQGSRIVGTLDTHLHADHLSRSHRIARALGVPYHVSGRARLVFPRRELSEGDRVRFGHAALEVIATPGHTWDHSTYRVGDTILTGDALFTDGVGRPDLGAGKEEVRDRAYALHDSLRRLASLPPETRVLPGHASVPTPFDGVEWSATVEEVRERVDWLSMDEASFVEAILARTPDVPEAYHRIVSFNRAGELPEDQADELESESNKCALGPSRLP